MSCKRIYKFAAIPRSGHHAIIHWFCSQLQGRTLFINNCYYRDQDAFYYASRDHAVMYDNGVTLGKSDVLPNGDDIDYYVYNFETLHFLKYLKNFRDVELFKRTMPGIRIFGSEELKLKGTIDELNIFIIRDVFNFMASVSRFVKNNSEWPNKDEIVFYVLNLWKEQAVLFLEHEGNVKDNVVWVKFNDWVISKDYRKTCASKLGIIFTDAGRECVSKYGGGSSFDGIEYDNQGSKMKVCERHKQDDVQKTMGIIDQESITLNSLIFGKT